MAIKNKKLSEAEAQEMLQELEVHFGERVAPVSYYCAAFEAWMKVLEDKYRQVKKEKGEKAAIRDVWGARIIPHFEDIKLHIYKSDLLARLVYGGEKLRTKPCPEHKGKWSGLHLEPCPHGCGYTGWLPELKEAKTEKEP